MDKPTFVVVNLLLSPQGYFTTLTSVWSLPHSLRLCNSTSISQFLCLDSFKHHDWPVMSPGLKRVHAHWPYVCLFEIAVSYHKHSEKTWLYYYRTVPHVLCDLYSSRSVTERLLSGAASWLWESILLAEQNFLSKIAFGYVTGYTNRRCVWYTRTFMSVLRLNT